MIRKIAKSLLALTLFLGMSFGAKSQETTSEISGTISLLFSLISPLFLIILKLFFSSSLFGYFSKIFLFESNFINLSP